MIGVHLGDLANAVFQSHGQDLRQVRRRPAAHAQQHVGVDLGGGQGRGDDVLAWHVGPNRVEQSHEPSAQCLSHAGDLVGLRVECAAAHDEHTLRAQQIRFLGGGLGHRDPDADSLHGRQGDER